jgi:hypothetical protein
MSRNIGKSPLELGPRDRSAGGWNMDRFCFKLAMMMIGAFLDPSSTTTAVKNVFRHVADVLQHERKRSTAIGPELSKEIILHVEVYDL